MSKSIFLSYVRGDDESFVAPLHADLIARGFDVWWDHASMPARGLTFLHEIRDDTRYAFHLENLVRQLCESIALIVAQELN